MRRTPGQGDEEPKKYESPSLTVDAAVIRGPPEALEILLVTRGKEPYQGKLAFPGGFVDRGEDPEVAVLRELEEECGVRGEPGPHLVAVRGDPKRDPGRHTVTVCYHVRIDPSQSVQAGDDASACAFYPVEELDRSQLAFDHAELLGQVLHHLEKLGGR